MARDPFADFNDSGLAAPPQKARSSGSSVLTRIVAAVSVLALVGLLLGYYLPLRKAHTLLSEKYQGSYAQLSGTADQLKKTTENLVSVQSERDALKEASEKIEQDKKAAEESVAKVTKGLEETLSSFLKSKSISIWIRVLIPGVLIAVWLAVAGFGEHEPKDSLSVGDCHL